MWAVTSITIVCCSDALTYGSVDAASSFRECDAGKDMLAREQWISFGGAGRSE